MELTFNVSPAPAPWPTKKSQAHKPKAVSMNYYGGDMFIPEAQPASQPTSRRSSQESAPNAFYAWLQGLFS